VNVRQSKPMTVKKHCMQYNRSLLDVLLTFVKFEKHC